MVQEQCKQLEMNFLLGYSTKIVIYRGELTYGRGGGVYWVRGLEFFQVGGWADFRLISEVGKTLHSSIFINANLFYTCYLFTPKLFHNCKWGISIHLKSKTNNGNAPAMGKDFRHENISGCRISKKKTL